MKVNSFLTLRALLDMRQYRLRAVDKDLGSVEDFYFDDRVWKVRYIVVDTGHWLPGRQVLIGQEALGQPDFENQVLPVALTSTEVEESPGIETALPFSLQKERELRLFFNWREYWSEDVFIQPGAFSPLSAPGRVATDPSLQERAYSSARLEGNPHLRSANDVQNYGILAKNDEIGHVAELMGTENLWEIGYLVIDTRNWLPGKEVLITPIWIEAVNWNQHLVEVDMTRESIEGSPEYVPQMPITREYEHCLYEYHGKPHDWD